MDIVIPLIEWSVNNFSELRYALRGFEKHIHSIDKVYIVGPLLPEWAQNVEHIFFKDDEDPRFREWNIYMKLMEYGKDKNSDFIYTNDDHFLLKRWDDFGYNFKSSLKQTLNQKDYGDPYRKTILNTIDVIGIPGAMNFDIHCPMIMHPALLKAIPINWKKPYGYCMKTVYVYKHDIQKRFLVGKVTDWKINDRNINLTEKDFSGFNYFSLSDKAWDFKMENLLKGFYPKKSKYEK